jgi:hypothetical protein
MPWNPGWEKASAAPGDRNARHCFGGKKNWRHKAWEGDETGLEVEKAEGPLRYWLFLVGSLLNEERAV